MAETKTDEDYDSNCTCGLRYGFSGRFEKNLLYALQRKIRSRGNESALQICDKENSMSVAL